MLIILHAITLAILIISTITDIKTRKIINIVSLSGIVLGLIGCIILCVQRHTPYYAIMGIGTVIVLFLFSMTGYLGGGDIKLLMMISLTTGTLTMLIGVMIASAVVIIWHLIKNPKRTKYALQSGFYIIRGVDVGEKTYIPFAPFLLSGYVVTCIIKYLIYGNLIWK